jgi:sugar-specific transcriptional regulator TrmB
LRSERTESQIQNWKKMLENTGLSEYEARVYLSLALKGPAEARKLSISSNVPRTKTYGVLKKLVERGLVAEMPGETSKYTAISPAESFNTFLQSLKAELSEKVTFLVEYKNVISLLEEIHKKRQLAGPIELQIGDVWFLHGRTEVLRKTKEMCSEAKKSVDILTTENGFILLYRAFNKLLDTLAQKHVNVLIRAPITPSNRNLARELRFEHKVEHENTQLPILFTCVDKRSFLLARLATDNPNLESEEDPDSFPKTRLSAHSLAHYSFLRSERQLGRSNRASRRIGYTTLR